MTEERRASPRRSATFAAEIQTSAGKSTIAITRDVSSIGLLVLSRRTLAIGETVTIRLVFENVIHLITCKVARQEALDAEESSLWRTKVGVVVEGADTILAKLFAAAAPA